MGTRSMCKGNDTSLGEAALICHSYVGMGVLILSTGRDDEIVSTEYVILV